MGPISVTPPHTHTLRSSHTGRFLREYGNKMTLRFADVFDTTCAHSFTRNCTNRRCVHDGPIRYDDDVTCRAVVSASPLKAKISRGSDTLCWLMMGRLRKQMFNSCSFRRTLHSICLNKILFVSRRTIFRNFLCLPV